MSKYLYIILAVALICNISTLLAEGTAAGTEIKNQASATYESGGKPYTTNSNVVITTVNPVYSFTVTPDGADTASPGQTQNATVKARVYFPYTIHNASNTNESFEIHVIKPATTNDSYPATVKIYHDKNGNGIVDPGETDLGNVTPKEAANLPADQASWIDFPNVAMDSYDYFIVSYVVDDVDPAGSPADKIYFNPIVAAGTATEFATNRDDDNFHETVVVEGPVLTINMTADKLQVKPNDAVTFTLSGSNTGNQPAQPVDLDFNGDSTLDAKEAAIGDTGILIANEIPTGLNFDFTEAALEANITWSGVPANAYVIGWDDNGGSPRWEILLGNDGQMPGTANFTGISRVGLFIPGASNSDLIITGANFEFNYVVSVPGTPAWQNLEDDPAQVQYDDDTTATVSVKTTKSNAVILSIDPAANAAVQSGGKLAIGTYTMSVANGTQVDSVTAGKTYTFENQAQNKGALEDTLNLTYAFAGATTNPHDGANEAWPAWQNKVVVVFISSDGSTPLQDSDGDGKPDLGLVPATGVRTFFVRVTIPSEAVDSTDQYDLLITLSSGADSDIKDDQLYDRINGIAGADVDVKSVWSDGGSYKTTDEALDIDTVNGSPLDPGDVVYYPMEITNTGSNDDVYNITHDLTGYDVTFYPWTDDGDGVVDTGEVDFSSPITNTPSIGSTDTYTFVIEIKIPDNAPPANEEFNVVVTSTQNNTETDTLDPQTSGPQTGKDITFSITTVIAVTFEPNRNGTAVPGGTITYDHVLTNTGNVEEDFEFTVASTFPGWSYVLYQVNGTALTLLTDTDSDGDIDIPNVPAYSAAAPTANKVTLRVKVFIPTNAAVNTADPATITVVAQHSSATPVAATDTKSVQDTTIVIAGIMQLVKSVDKNTANPGETLTYTIDYKNLSTSNVQNFIVYDQIPANTVLLEEATTIYHPANGTTEIVEEYSIDGSAYEDYVDGNRTQYRFIKWDFSALDIDSNVDSTGTPTARIVFKVEIK